MKPVEAATATGAAPAPQSAGPCVMVIFGASGDLTKRKLIPALYNLARDKLLPEQFAVVGFATGDFDATGFRRRLGEDIRSDSTEPIDAKCWDWLARRIYYVRGSFEDANAYASLAQVVEQASSEHGAQANLFHYLAVAPRFFGGIVERLGAAGLTRESNGQWRRVVIEKPFDRDLESARSLNAGLKQVLAERLLYDCMIGDQTLVQRADMVEAGWSLIQPVIDVWRALPERSFPNYAAGTWGPADADELLARDGWAWGRMSP